MPHAAARVRGWDQMLVMRIFFKNSVLIVRETEARQQRLRREWVVGR